MPSDKHIDCPANSDTSLTLDCVYTVNTVWNSDNTVKSYGSSEQPDRERQFSITVTGVSGAEVRNSSGTKITSMTRADTAYLYVPSNGGTSSSRTVTVKVSSSDSDNCSSSTSGLTAE